MSNNHNTNINDIVQEKFDYSKFKFLRTLIVLGTGGIIYTKIGMNNFIKAMIIYAILMCIRWILSEITVVKKFEKKQYVLSGHIMLFTVLLIVASNSKLFYMDNRNVFIGCILLYSLINIITGGTTTTNALFSLLVVYAIYNVKYVSTYLYPNIQNHQGGTYNYDSGDYMAGDYKNNSGVYDNNYQYDYNQDNYNY